MISYIIIALNCIISFIGFGNRSFFAKYMYNPYSLQRNKKEWYRIFSHAFLHADYMHLLFNMFTFYSFGLALEQDIFPVIFTNHASYYFLVLYVGGILASAIPAYEKHKDDFSYNAVGASGAVSAVMFSYILLLPTSSLSLLFLPIPIPAAFFGILFLVISWYLSRRGGGHIAHDAHIWGGIFGFIFTALLKPSLLLAFFSQLKDLF
ncbi:MAG: rhomboid family intramembrane serine protease [Bacteroidia bacterium]|jgi:membrane associated rhomboid family serine protease|nr:rhomboid family intramembrane serine protease [Bacteroidia bacterium]